MTHPVFTQKKNDMLFRHNAGRRENIIAEFNATII